MSTKVSVRKCKICTKANPEEHWRKLTEFSLAKNNATSQGLFVIESDLNNFRDFLNDKVQRLATILYKHQHHEHQKPIIDPNKFVQLIETRDPELIGFFDLLFQSTNPKEKVARTQEQLKKKVMLLCHCIASLRNKQITAAKSAIGLSLVSAGRL
ncbi:hypothetical protein RhiirA5_431013 [Rhizophagus irregularis]|uniref:Uncharacterized protein n=1 Tax=Rhizophagus irregularis TaxID=588596 RepID=A0A2N0NVR3_9GLOM|nr:hypothetical protein RhiirA5_431013 [Rhizophagus irregularis]